MNVKFFLPKVFLKHLLCPPLTGTWDRTERLTGNWDLTPKLTGNWDQAVNSELGFAVKITGNWGLHWLI